MTTLGTKEVVFLVNNIARSTMENNVKNKLSNHTEQDEVEDEDGEKE